MDINILLVPMNKAAEEFGVHRQTIANWHDAGLLQGTVIKGNRFITRESLDNLKSVYPEAAADANRVDIYKKEIETLQNELKDRRDALRKERIYRNYAPRFMHNFVAKFIKLMRAMNIIHVEDEKLENEFIHCWIFGHDIEESCKNNGVGYYSYLATVKKYIKLMRNMEAYEQLVMRNRELEEEMARMKTENDRLKTDMEEYRSRNTAVNNEENWKENYQILTKDLSDLDLTVKTYNILKMHGFKNLGQVIKHSRKELLKLRLFGMKCLVEIEDILEPYGLELGTDLSINMNDYKH